MEVIYSDKDNKDIEKLVESSRFQHYLEEYDRIYKESSKKRKTVYQKQVRAKSPLDYYKISKLMVKVTVLTLVASLAVKAGANIYYDNTAQKYAQKMVNAEDSHLTLALDSGFIDIYDPAIIAANIVNYNGPRDIDAIIYAYFVEIKYNVEEIMDRAFDQMQKLINEKQQNNIFIADDILSSCNYPDFSSYLKAKGFKDTIDYKHRMDRLLTAYSHDDLEKALDIIEEISSNMKRG